MMYGYGNGMMGEAGIFMLLTWIIVLVDLVLVGIWLWQHITKK